MYYFKFLFTIIFILVLFCSSAQKNINNTRVPESGISVEPNSEINLTYSVFLIGNIKNPSPNNEALKLLQSKLNQQNENSALVVLGNIVYNNGLPDSLDHDYQQYADTLKNILKSIEGFKGQIVFIPGNHDWEQGRSQGLEHVNNSEVFIENYLGRGNIFFPDGGCPGPVELNLSDDITLVLFDTQWWFHKFNKPGMENDCGFENETELIMEIKDILRRNQNKKVLFAAHHPLYSVGEHGGNFPLSSLLFPFLKRNRSLFIPAPGFLYTSYRKYFGFIQDLAHPEYKQLKDYFLSIFNDFPNLIYTAGHEHNLQYVEKNQMHHIISGGGGEATFVASKKRQTDFAAQRTGFSVLNFYANGDVWLEFLSPDKTGKGEVLFRKKLYNKPVYNKTQEQAKLNLADFSDSIVNVQLSNEYEAGKLKRWWKGANYRDLWSAKVHLPVFDIGTEKGGLKILKRGGGMQTRSIRMKNPDGKQYVLRSMNKYVERALPGNFKNTFIVNMVQDAISEAHPYSAVTVPPMADAIGVMHTNPKVVWVPDDPRLGVYRQDLANGVYLFEERPSGKWKNLDSFGNSKDIVSTDEVIKNIYKKHGHSVDQEAVLKARLFDLLINDWDRHDDQWRWASFKKKSKTVYRPIPRDRDQVFFVNEGVLPWLASRKWINPKFQDFGPTITNVSGLAFNARYFDRSFLTEPNLDTWLNTANTIQQQITDSVIGVALKKMPDEIYQLSGEEIKNKLISRKEKLHDYAKEYYLVLAEAVDIVGTEDRELFEANRLPNGNIDLSVIALSDKKGKEKEQIYHREFSYDETKEIRLYGLGGKDKFVINGKAEKGIKVRIIGGKGNDSISDYSKINGFSKKTVVYDRKDKKNSIHKGPETKLKLSNHKEVNLYDRKQFKYNTTAPVAYFGFNIDDGLFIGAGINNKRYNFRDFTFHKFHVNYAYETGAFAAYYNGWFSSVSQKFDLLIDVEASIPNNVNNFFGFGNETVRTIDDEEYYRMRYHLININPKIQRQLNRYISYSIGAFYQFAKIEDVDGRFITSEYKQILGPEAFLNHHYGGFKANFNIDARDNDIFPKRGIVWSSEATEFIGLNEKSKSFLKLKSDLSLYLSFRTDPRVVLAIRGGGAINVGDYEFYHANFIGGKTNVRGLYSNRYAGDKSFYQNTEVRIKLSNLKSHFFNGQLGFLVFNDFGRVWYNNEKSNTWHRGSGVGLWLTPFDFTVLTATYNFSKEEDSFGFAVRYMF